LGSGHLRARGKPDNWSGFERFLDSVDKLGLQIFVTDLDVDDSELPGGVSERDAAVAKVTVISCTALDSPVCPAADSAV